MGNLQCKAPPMAAEALKYLQAHELSETSSIFDKLSSVPPGGNTTHSAIDRTVFGEYFAYPGVLRERIFEVFDTNKDGLINREEFICGLAICCRGSLDKKLSFCFSMFDLSGDGYVDRNELSRCLLSTAFASFALLHAVSRELNSLNPSDYSSRQNEYNDHIQDIHPSEFQEEIEIMVDEAFKNCDTNEDGKLSMTEFRSWMLCTPEVVRILYGVFEMRNHVELADVEREFFEAKKTDNANIDKELSAVERRIPILLEVNQKLREEHETILRTNEIYRRELNMLVEDHPLCRIPECRTYINKTISSKKYIEEFTNFSDLSKCNSDSDDDSIAQSKSRLSFRKLSQQKYKE